MNDKDDRKENSENEILNIFTAQSLIDRHEINDDVETTNNGSASTYT